MMSLQLRGQTLLTVIAKSDHGGQRVTVSHRVRVSGCSNPGFTSPASSHAAVVETPPTGDGQRAGEDHEHSPPSLRAQSLRSRGLSSAAGRTDGSDALRRPRNPRATVGRGCRAVTWISGAAGCSRITHKPIPSSRCGTASDDAATTAADGTHRGRRGPGSRGDFHRRRGGQADDPNGVRDGRPHGRDRVDGDVCRIGRDGVDPDICTAGSDGRIRITGRDGVGRGRPERSNFGGGSGAFRRHSNN